MTRRRARGTSEDRDRPVNSLVLDAAVHEPRVQRVPGVVDQQVDRPVGIAEPLLDAGAVCRVGEIGWEHLGVDAVRCTQVVGQGAQPTDVARHEHEVVAVGRQPARECLADAGGGAGDERPTHQDPPPPPPPPPPEDPPPPPKLPPLPLDDAGAWDIAGPTADENSFIPDDRFMRSNPPREV
jgi:hypothetical protein